MNYEGLIKTILRKLSKNLEKLHDTDDADRKQLLHVFENLDWYYVEPTEMFRRLPSLYSLFDSDGVPTHDVDGNELDESTIQQLRKEWEWQKEFSDKLENLALQNVTY